MKVLKRSLAATTIIALLAATLCLVLPYGFKPAAEYNDATQSYVLYDTTENDLDISDGVLNGFKSAFDAHAAHDVNLVVPSTVTQIAAGAFDGEQRIIAVTLENKDVTIGDNAFRECRSLVEVRHGGKYTAADPQPSWTGDGYLAYSALNICESAAATEIEIDGNGFVFCADTRGDNSEYLVGYIGNATAIELPAREHAYSIRQYAFHENTAIETVASASGANITRVGDYAFYGCTSLKSVALPSGVERIGDSAFQGDGALSVFTMPTALETIGADAFASTALTAAEIPAGVTAIGNEAFYRCASMTSLTFAAGGENGLSIGLNAFAECSRINVADLPARLSSIAPHAFAGASLNSVYIHGENVAFGTNAAFPDNKYFNDAAAIIFDNRAQYDANANKIPAHSAQLTYVVNVTFENMNATGNSVTLERLYGKGFDWVKAADKTWARGENVTVPVQDGYAYSVWTDAADGSRKIKTNDANAIGPIGEQLSTATQDITYTAVYVKKPVLTAETGLTYQNANYYFPLWDLVRGEEDTTNLSITASGDKLSADGRVQNAGTYTVTVALDRDKDIGEWATPVTTAVTVDRALKAVGSDIVAIELNDTDSAIGNGPVYVYEDQSKPDTADDKYMYYAAMLAANQIPSGYTFHSVIDVSNSVVVKRTTSPLKLSFSVAGHGDPVYTAEPEAEKSGRYTTTATIGAGDNYRFSTSGGDVRQGLTIYVNDDGTTATVSKVWYVVEVSNALMRNEPDGTALTVPYGITGWTYNQAADVTINVPMPKFSPSSADDRAAFNMAFTFKLERNGYEVVDGKTVKDLGEVDGEFYHGFEYYINKSMPAGDYRLTIHVPAIADDLNHTSHFGYDDVYTFTVTPAAITDAWRTDLKTKLKDVEWQYAEVGGEPLLQIYHHSDFNDNHGVHTGRHNVDLAVWNSSVVLNPVRTGFWALDTNNGYYSDRFYLTYNLARMQNNTYYTYREIEQLARNRVPKAVDTYTVYYQLRAENYEPLVDIYDNEDRYKSNFTVVIYDVIVVGTVENAVYTGGDLRPVFTDTRFSAVYNTAEGYYVNAATAREVTLVSNDPEHYRWSNVNDGNGADGPIAEHVISFDIEKADNATVSLDLYAWVYGDYTKDANNVAWQTRFGDKNAQSFKLVANNAEKTEYTDFGKAPAGEYTLVATSAAGANWKEFTDTRAFNILKGTNRWTQTPNIMQWRFGGFNRDVNLIIAEPLYASAVKFKITTDADGNNAYPGLEDIKVTDGKVTEEVAEILADMKAGTYYLCAEVVPTAEYSALKPEPLAFEVTVANNYWINAPEIADWVEGEYDSVANAVKGISAFAGKSFNVVITAAGDENNIIYDKEKGIDNLRNAKVGAYVLRAYVAGTSDYAELDYTVTFNVFEAPGMPWWGILLIVLGVLALVAIVMFVLHRTGVLQILTGKIVLAIRNRATIDATIASVRASKVAEESRKSINKAKMEELNEARKRAREEERNMPLEERLAKFEAKAQENVEIADKYNAKAENIRKKASEFKEKHIKNSNASADAQAEPAAEADVAATDPADDGDAQE